jgi:hypothetical protein
VLPDESEGEVRIMVHTIHIADCVLEYGTKIDTNRTTDLYRNNLPFNEKYYVTYNILKQEPEFKYLVRLTHKTEQTRK